MRLSRIFALALLLSFFLLCALPFLSCGSRAKQAVRTESKAVSAVKVDSNAVVAETSQLRKTTDEFGLSVLTRDDIEYDGAAGDHVLIETFGPDGKLQSSSRLSGAGRAKVSRTTKNSTFRKTGTENLEKKSDAKIHVIKSATSEIPSPAKVKPEKTSGFSFWTWLWIFIAIVIIVLAIRFRKRLQGFFVKNRVTHQQ